MKGDTSKDWRPEDPGLKNDDNFTRWDALKVRQYRGGFLLKQCPPGSQGARGQLNTGFSGLLEVVLVARKPIFRPDFSLGVSTVHSTMFRLMQWVLVDRGYGKSQAGCQIGKGLGNVMAKEGLGCRWARGRVDIWVMLQLGGS